jgi:hypothetical protein
MTHRAGAILAGLGTAAALGAVVCGYPLWVQFRGPLPEHAAPGTSPHSIATHTGS